MEHIRYFPEIGNSSYELLISRMLENSEADTWEQAKDEWKATGFGVEEGHENGEGIQCVCRKHINRVYYVDNATTNKTMWLGSECIINYLNAITCKNCETPLKSVAKRLETKDFICVTCKRFTKSEIKRLGRYTWLIKDTWYRMKFEDLILNEAFLDYYANLKYSNSTIRAFEEFLDLQGYEIKELIVSH